MIGDLASRTSDPYVVATLHTSYSGGDPDHSPPLRFRTHTVPDTVDPAWECAWHVSNVPRNGSCMRVEVFDEDVGGHDDMLGHVDVDLSALGTWEVGRVEEQAYKLRKRHADKKATVINFLSAGWAYHDGTGRNEKVVISVLVNGLTPKARTNGLLRPFTTGPSKSVSSTYRPAPNSNMPFFFCRLLVKTLFPLNRQDGRQPRLVRSETRESLVRPLSHV